MYAGDAADLLYECVSHDNIFGDVFFAVHREQHYSVMDIAQEIVSVFRKGRIHQVPWPEVRKRIEIDNAVISGDKLYQAVHFEPKYIFRQGLERTRQIIESRKDMKTTGKGASV
jgi:nucleoside-diphosphate-sugar epimerase